MIDPMRSRGGVGESWARQVDILAGWLATSDNKRADLADANRALIAERDAALAQSDEWHEKFQAEMERNAAQALELDAALARAEKAEGERDGFRAHFTSALEAAGVALARNRALEEGLEVEREACARLAGNRILSGSGRQFTAGHQYACEVISSEIRKPETLDMWRRIVVAERTLLVPASPETTIDGKDAT